MEKTTSGLKLGLFKGLGLSLLSLSSRQLERSSTWQRLTWILHQQQFAQRPQTVWAHTQPHQTPRYFYFFILVQPCRKYHAQVDISGPTPQPHQTRHPSQFFLSFLFSHVEYFPHVVISGHTITKCGLLRNSTFAKHCLFRRPDHDITDHKIEE